MPRRSKNATATKDTKDTATRDTATETTPLPWNCPLHRDERNLVTLDTRNAVTNDTDIFIVGEAPGPEEYKQGYPFVGPSGQLLREFLRRAGLLPRCIFTNVCWHWPTEPGSGSRKKTRKPTPQEILACLPHLDNAIELWKPKLIIAVGDTAAKVFGAKGTIGEAQGKFITWRGIQVMPVYHPSYLLRNSKVADNYRRAEEAVRAALQLCSWWLRYGHLPVPDYKSLVPSQAEDIWVQPGAALDTETTSKSFDADLVLASMYKLGWDEPVVWHPERVHLGNGVTFWNALFDLVILNLHGSNMPKEVDDGMVLAWLLQEEHKGLKWQAMHGMQTPVMTYEEMMATPGWEAKLNYSAQDAVITAKRFAELRPRLNAEEAWCYDSIYRKLLPILARASITGFVVDHKGLTGYLQELWQRRVVLLEMIRSYAWPTFNPGSPPQIRKLLFGVLGLPKVGLTKTGNDSTDEDTLIALSDKHPAASLLLGWRSADKIIGTYIKQLLQKPTCHTYYQATGTETGRLSCSGLGRGGLNLQNQPKRIKKYLHARPGNTLLIADYAQIELRFATALSQDPVMITAIRNGIDLHTQLALAVWPEYSEKTLPKDLRQRAKFARFERLYGGGDDRMAKTLKVPLSKAQQFGNLYPGMEKWVEATASEALRSGYIKTIFGRRRKLWDAYSTSGYLRNKAGREAINTPVQGSVADVVNLAMVTLDPWLAELGGWILHQEHDCIVSEVPNQPAIVADAKEAVRRAMLEVIPSWITDMIPIELDLKVSENWV